MEFSTRFKFRREKVNWRKVFEGNISTKTNQCRASFLSNYFNKIRWFLKKVALEKVISLFMT